MYLMRSGRRGSCHIIGGGVLPSIHSVLVPRGGVIGPEMLAADGVYADGDARAALISTGLKGGADACGDMQVLCVTLQSLEFWFGVCVHKFVRVARVRMCMRLHTRACVRVVGLPQARPHQRRVPSHRECHFRADIR